MIQNSQIRDTEAIQIKLDELIRVTKGAQNALLDLEEPEPAELAKFRASYTALASKAKDLSDASVSESGVHHVELDGIPQEGSAADDAVATRDRASVPHAAEDPSRQSTASHVQETALPHDAMYDQ